MSERKTSRVMIRVTPKTKEHFEKVADRLHTNLSDMLLVGGLIIEAQCPTAADYLRRKAAALEGGVKR